MTVSQKGILAPVPKVARYLVFSLRGNAKPISALKALSKLADGDSMVVGLGESLIRLLDGAVPGLRIFPSDFGRGLVLPSTTAELWCWLRGDDRGKLLHAGQQCIDAVASAFVLDSVIDGFQFAGGRDLTGFVDGTENPQEKQAEDAAIVRGHGAGLDGSSFVAVQQWVHDFPRFNALPSNEQDNAIGRRRDNNEELSDAPTSAHVKRTAQPSFVPEAFILRRSLPWIDGNTGGLYFVAFGKSFDAFEAQLKRMVGAKDGIADALFTFTRPVTGNYFWCPPMTNGHLNLSVLGIEVSGR